MIIHEGNTDALNFLIRKYQSFVRLKARSYFLIGGDREDIIQEGMIGLYKAIRDFKEDQIKFIQSVCGTLHHTANYYCY